MTPDVKKVMPAAAVLLPETVYWDPNFDCGSLGSGTFAAVWALKRREGAPHFIKKVVVGEALSVEIRVEPDVACKVAGVLGTSGLVTPRMCGELLKKELDVLSEFVQVTSSELAPEPVEEGDRRTLVGPIGIPYVISSSFNGPREAPDFDYLVLPRYGTNLEQLFDSVKKKKGLGRPWMSFATVARIGIQMINRIKSCHDRFVLHRDVKAENFVVGRSGESTVVHRDSKMSMAMSYDEVPKHRAGISVLPSSDLMFIIDFGLADYWADDNELHRPHAKAHEGLVGTPRFASVNAHLGHHSRRDDLISVGYLLVYLAAGRLPWQSISSAVQSHEARLTEIRECKELVPNAELSRLARSPELGLYLDIVTRLRFDERPPYEVLKAIIIHGLFTRWRAFENKTKELRRDLRLSWDWDLLTDDVLALDIDECDVEAVEWPPPLMSIIPYESCFPTPHAMNRKKIARCLQNSCIGFKCVKRIPTKLWPDDEVLAPTLEALRLPEDVIGLFGCYKQLRDAGGSVYITDKADIETVSTAESVNTAVKWSPGVVNFLTRANNLLEVTTLSHADTPSKSLSLSDRQSKPAELSHADTPSKPAGLSQSERQRNTAGQSSGAHRVNRTGTSLTTDTHMSRLHLHGMKSDERLDHRTGSSRLNSTGSGRLDIASGGRRLDHRSGSSRLNSTGSGRADIASGGRRLDHRTGSSRLNSTGSGRLDYHHTASSRPDHHPTASSRPDHHRTASSLTDHHRTASSLPNHHRTASSLPDHHRARPDHNGTASGRMNHNRIASGRMDHQNGVGGGRLDHQNRAGSGRMDHQNRASHCSRKRGVAVAESPAVGFQEAAKDKRSEPFPEIAEIAKRIRGVYNDRCAFPEWCVSDEYLKSDHGMFSKKVLMFYDKSDDLIDVCRVANERQPTNIGMRLCHDEGMFRNVLQEFTGSSWTESYYTSMWKDQGTLAPNIAVYCETPAFNYKKQLDKYNKTESLTLRVLNVVGIAFDAQNQPDAEYFGYQNGKPTELHYAIKRVFQKILACVEAFRNSNQAIEWMHVPKFGCGAFAGRRSEEVNEIWDKLWDEFEPKWKELGVKATNENIYSGTLQDMQPFGKWAEFAKGQKHGGLRHRLFINAWDPHSIAGNANFADASMDGYYGRSTAIGLLCWPMTNASMNLISVSTERR